MNHHNLTISPPTRDAGRQSLIQCVAGTLRELVRLAEMGATQSEMTAAAMRAGAQCTQTALDAGPSGDPVDLVVILRRLLRKEARRRWEMSGEQECHGNSNAALGDRKVSILLDASADALGAPLTMTKPAAVMERFSRANEDARGISLTS